jgi:glycerol-3-phosphate acyltransferase PlsY
LGSKAFALTAILDGIKAIVAILIVRHFIAPHLLTDLRLWPEALTGVMVVIGHNWSLFLRFKGGAGTSAFVGAAIALWGWTLLIVVLCGVAALYVSSMASIGSLVAVWSVVLAFLLRSIIGNGSWEHSLFSVIAALLIVISLLPNISRLRAGSERRIWFGLNKRKHSE